MTVPIQSSIDMSMPICVGRSAHGLQQREATELSTQLHFEGDPLSLLENKTLWQYQEKTVVFASIGARNQCAAAFAHAEWLVAETGEKGKLLFDKGYELWGHEIDNADQACGRLLALAHRSVNVFEVATNLLAATDHDVWNLLYLIESALPYLDSIAADDLVKLVEAQHKRTKDAALAGALLVKLQETLARDVAACRNLHATVNAQLTIPTVGLYQTSLLALAGSGNLAESTSMAIKDAESSDALLRRFAHWGIALLLAQYEIEDGQYDRCVEILRAACQSEDIELRTTAINGISHAAGRYRDLRLDLLKLGNTKDQPALSAVANFIYRNFEAARQDALFLELMNSLTELCPEATAGLRDFDSILSWLVDKQESDLVFECLTTWSIKHGGVKMRDDSAVEVFDRTLRKLIMQPEQLSRLLTEWLVADERELGVAACGLIGYLWVRKARQVTFSRKALDRLTANEMVYLARRMLGYASFHDELLLSLTFSLMNTQDAKNRTHGLVASILINEVGRDFRFATIQAVEAHLQSCSTEDKALLLEVRSRLNEYADALTQLPQLDELRPPLALYRANALKRARGMQKSMEKANEKSIFIQISTQVSLKAGIGWFSFDKGEIGKTHYLQQTSHAVTYPRRATSDPLNYALNGMRFRLATKEEE
jgi:hypothetical protein